MPCPTLAMWSWRCAGQSRPRHPVRFRNTGIALSHSSPQPHLMIVIHSLSGGGAERVAADLSAYWVQRGYKVTLVTQAHANTDAYPLHAAVKRYALGTAGSSGGRVSAVLANLRRVWSLRQLIKREQPTVVLGMMTTASVLAIAAARGQRCRVIATEHTHPPSQELPAMWERLRRWAYPQACAVVALTSGTAAWLEKNVPGSRLTVIPNAVRWQMVRAEPVIEPARSNGSIRGLACGGLPPT